LSPEICQKRRYDYKSDIWGLGCVLYEMCALKPAFAAQDLKTLVQSIVDSSYRPIPYQYSKELGELVRVMLKPQPESRPTANMILNSKAMTADVLNYMQFVKSLPKALDGVRQDRKGSSSSMSENPLSTNSGELATLV